MTTTTTTDSNSSPFTVHPPGAASGGDQAGSAPSGAREDTVHRSPTRFATVRDRAARVGVVVKRVAGRYRPPEFWGEGLPPARDVVAYSRRGDWTTATVTVTHEHQPTGETAQESVASPLRRWHLAYTWAVAVPVHAVCRYAVWLVTTTAALLGWVVDRPSRCAAAAALATALTVWVAL